MPCFYYDAMQLTLVYCNKLANGLSMRQPALEEAQQFQGKEKGVLVQMMFAP
jgi:hypothetical protein